MSNLPVPTRRPTRSPQELQRQPLQRQDEQQRLQQLEQAKVEGGEPKADPAADEAEPAKGETAQPNKKPVSAETRRDARARFAGQADVLRAQVDGQPTPAAGAPDLTRDFKHAPPAEVKDLQTYLNRQGEALKVDGKFGPKSEAALERVRDNPVDLDGTHWKSASTTDVKRLQRLLNARGEELKVDGKFGPKSEAALGRVQQSEAKAQAEAAAVAKAKAEAAAVETETAPAGDKAAHEKAETTTAPPDETLPHVADDPVGRRRASRKHGPRAGLALKQQREAEAAAAAKAKSEAEAAAKARAEILGKDYSKESPAEDVEKLQTYLGARGYEVGDADGKWGPRTEAGLKLARRRDELLATFSDTDSTNADNFRYYSPLPSNVDNVIASVTGMDTAITNKSLTEGEQLVVYQTVLNAMERTGEAVGGTKYQDYADPEFHDLFNKGNVPHGQMLTRSFGDDKFRMATLMGRSTFMQDPEDPDKIYVFDKTDWNPSEKNFEVKDEAESVLGSIWNNLTEGDFENLGPDAYKRFRNWMRDGDDGGKGTENRTFVVLSRKEMEAAKARLNAPPAEPNREDGRENSGFVQTRRGRRRR